MDIAAHSRARALMEVLRFDDAIRALEQALTRDPEDERALYLIGHCHLVMQREEEAQRFAKAAIAGDPTEAAFHVLLANAVLNAHRPERAILHADDAIGLDPHSAEAHFIRGAALFSAGRKEEALNALGEALRLEPDHARALAFRSTVLEATAHHERAAGSIAAALRIDPADAHTLAVKAWNDFVHQRPVDHRQAFRDVLARSPMSRVARRGLFLSTAWFPRMQAERERRAQEGPAADGQMDWARFASVVAFLTAAICFGASRLQPPFIAFYGAFFIVLAMLFLEILPCVFLLPSLLHRFHRDLIPARERRMLLAADLLLVIGALWCAVSPVVRGMHSVWGLIAMTCGTMILSIRFKSPSGRDAWLRWSYLGLSLGLFAAGALVGKPHGYWVSAASLLLIILWFRFNRFLDRH